MSYRRDTTKRRRRRLEPDAYRGEAYVHWTVCINDRRTGWLTPVFYYRFRELLTHSLSRYHIVCPMYCLMPDHMHLVWIGISDQADQRLAIRHLLTSANESLGRIGFGVQTEPYDHVLRDDERKEEAFVGLCDYVARNPERRRIVPIDGYASYSYTGCLVPGYPELRPFAMDYWTRFWRVRSYLVRRGGGTVSGETGYDGAGGPTPPHHPK